MKVVCVRNKDSGGSIPWTKESHYHKLKVGHIYEGQFIEKMWGGKPYTVVHLKEFNYDFQTAFKQAFNK